MLGVMSLARNIIRSFQATGTPEGIRGSKQLPSDSHQPPALAEKLAKEECCFGKRSTRKLTFRRQRISKARRIEMSRDRRIAIAIDRHIVKQTTRHTAKWTVPHTVTWTCHRTATSTSHRTEKSTYHRTARLTYHHIGTLRDRLLGKCSNCAATFSTAEYLVWTQTSS